MQSDRIRFDPERSESEGVELLLRGGSVSRNWWVHYARARSRDRLGGRSVPSPFDQTDAVTLQFDQKFAGSWTVLFFYPKASTPGCTKEACAFTELGPAFAERDVQVFGISAATRSPGPMPRAARRFCRPAT